MDFEKLADKFIEEGGWQGSPRIAVELFAKWLAEQEVRPTPRALDGATGLCKCDTGYPFATHPICGICGLPRQ